MSRVGKVPVVIPSGVDVSVSGCVVTVSGPLGRLTREFNDCVSFCIEDGKVRVDPNGETKEHRAMWGTARSVLNGMVSGVSKGFKTELEVNGVGYRAAMKGQMLNMSLGKSHSVKIEIPQEVKVETPKQTIVILSSIDKELLGRVAARIIQQRPPEPYKGKGIKRKGQYVQRKETKKS